MNLRKLEQKDAPLMLEWMHDKSITGCFRTDFASKTLDDCKAFITAAEDTSTDLHMAVADDSDTYMGTVSLKHIQDGSAEFAITVRKDAMGKGFSRYGMKEIIKIGFDEIGLNRIYWSVKPDNLRAIRFYNKNGYKQTSATALTIPSGGGGGTAPLKFQRIFGIKSMCKF